MIMPMARDLGKYGIRVAAVAPGLISTQMTAAMATGALLKKNLREFPLGRLGT